MRICAKDLENRKKNKEKKKKERPINELIFIPISFLAFPYRFFLFLRERDNATTTKKKEIDCATIVALSIVDNHYRRHSRGDFEICP